MSLFLTPQSDEVLEIIQHMGGMKALSRDIFGFAKSAADGGDVKAQQILSVYYECLSENVDQDERDLAHDVESECRRYCALAAEQGDTISLYRLGTFYETGRFGLSKDMAAAFRCYAKAADQGSSAAQYSVGRCYENGIGVEPDFERAVHYYSLVVGKGNGMKYEQSVYALARCFRDGKGVASDVNKALELFRRTILDDSRLWCVLLDATVRLQRYRGNFCSGATKVVRSSSGPHAPVCVVQLAAGPSDDSNVPNAPVLLEQMSFNSIFGTNKLGALAYSGQRIAAACRGSIHLFSVATFGFEFTLPSDHNKSHDLLAGFSSGPGHFLAVRAGNLLNVWDIRRGSAGQSVLVRPGISGFSWAPVGAVIAVWTDKKCEFIDCDDENEKGFVVNVSDVISAAWSGTGTRVALSTIHIDNRLAKTRVAIVETNTRGERVCNIEIFDRCRCVWSLGGDKLILYYSAPATSRRYSRVAVWNTTTTPYRCELNALFRQERLLDVGASDQLGQLLVVLSKGFRVFTLNTESAKFEQRTVFPGPFKSAMLSPDLALAALFGGDQQVSLLSQVSLVSVAEQRVERLVELPFGFKHGWRLPTFQFSPDSAFLFVGWERCLSVWNTAGQPTCQLQRSNDTVIQSIRIIPRSDSSTCSIVIGGRNLDPMKLYSFDVGAVRKTYTGEEWNRLAQQALTFVLCWRRHRAAGPTIAVIEDQVLRSVPPLIAQKIVDYLLFGPMPNFRRISSFSGIPPQFDDESSESEDS